MANFCVDNRDAACYLVTKHSWRGKYKRIFSIGSLAITTYNPQTLEITNQWLYDDFVLIKPSPRNTSSGDGRDEFVIHTKKGKKDSMRFSCDYTSEVLTDVLLHHPSSAEEKIAPTFNGYKHSWSEKRLPVRLRVGVAALEQIDSRGVVFARYLYKNIRNIGRIADCPGGFVVDVGEQRRRHIFACAEVDEVIKTARSSAAKNIGLCIPLGKETLTLEEAMRTRLGLCSRDESVTSYMERDVQKFSVRHDSPVRRLLCLSESCLVERDPRSYAVISATPLKHIVCIVRLLKDPQQFTIEYETGEARAYATADRDLIIASLIDGARASGNSEVFVAGHRFDRSLRLLPYAAMLDEDGESQCMRHIIAPPPGLKRADLIRRFNANVPYNGLAHTTSQESFFTENKEKVIVGALEAVLMESYTKEEPNGVHKCEEQLNCLRRLFASKSGFHSFTEVDGVREKLGLLIARLLQWKVLSIDYAAVELLCSLMHPMHANFNLRKEQLNKASLLSSPPFVEHLLDLLVSHVEHGTGWLVISSMLDFLTYAVCAPYSETTSGETFDLLLKMVAERGRAFYTLFQSQAMTIVKGAGMVMRAIIEESELETSKAMQALALTQGAFLSHLEMSLLSTGGDLRVLANRQLSGHLISLWIADHEDANDLLSRCLPRGLLDFLKSTEKVENESDFLTPRNNLDAAISENKHSAVKERLNEFRVGAEARIDRFIQHWDLEKKLNFQLPRRDQEKNERPVVLRRRRQRVKSPVNWKMFANQFRLDHAKADLIWNEKTREEFRHAIKTELRTLDSEKEQTLNKTPISWNHTEFQVMYPSLADEIKIGDYYLRLLLQENEGEASPIHNASEFFNSVYHRLLLPCRAEMRCLCLSAMAIAYERSHDSIGYFSDTKHFISLLSKCTVPAERDRLVLLLSKLALNKENARELILAEACPVLVDLAVLAHLHVQRAAVHNESNVIEAGADQTAEGGSPEWHYKTEKNDDSSSAHQHGPFSFEKMKELYTEGVIFERTPVWAAGMPAWQHLSTVPQFRWTVCVRVPEGPSASSASLCPVYNFSQLAALCLDILIQMCSFFPSRDSNESVVRPMPRIKKILTEPALLYQIVQLLLTYDPAIVQRVATLVYLIMQDNPMLSRLYLSGIFFYLLMYNGSNILPIARLLHYTHLHQAFRSAIPRLEGHSQSVLTPLLPESATFYLEHYGPEKYAEVFLGEFDNPEIIWNTVMRRHLISQIAIHIADFSTRLSSNVKALYQYCPIPLIEYPELTNELFCHVYYLRHLCDKERYPDWPIRDPIPFLRSCLAAWHEEIEKKPPSMTSQDAAETLGLPSDAPQWESGEVRRAYFKLATKYHPDKNPEGREMFEKINAAYELLSSSAAGIGAADPKRIVLCLRAQSIIYTRHSKELSAYKYAGYGQLIKTIDIEAKDSQLFQKGGGELLSAAIELANYTLMSSALNAEQLRREQGLEALQVAFDRCVPMLNLSSTPDQLSVQVSQHICNCFGTAARFEACRQRIAEMPTIFGNICRLLQFPHLSRLCSAAASCICSLGVCTLLQTQLFQAGVLWHLIPPLFHYDFTLDEGGVSHSEETNKQALSNKLARMCCEALACLAGFRPDTPDNDGVQNSLRALLTPAVCRSMRDSDADSVLKLLNSNTENPYLIWDNSTRAELLEFVERHRTSNEQTSELFGAEFRLSVYAKELIVGDILVRVYNEQPDFPITDAKSVCVDLLAFLKKHAEGGERKEEKKGELLIDLEVDRSESGRDIQAEQRAALTITALFNLLSANPGAEILLVGHFELLLSYLRCRLHPQLQVAALQIISVAANNRECVQDLARVRACSSIFTLMTERRAEALSLALRTFIALAANPQITKEILDCGGLLYILSVVVQPPSADISSLRLVAAELFAKLQTDKLSGPRWTRFLCKFLPPIFADAFRDSSSTAITMFDSTNENPEIIWNDELRGIVRETVQEALNTLYNKERDDPAAKWDTLPLLSDDSWCAYSSCTEGELVVGGVFLRLFIANPSWNVRHPRQFATELIEKVLEAMSVKAPPAISFHLPTLTTAFIQLIKYHSSAADQLPGQGYLPHFCTAMNSGGVESARSALLILEQLAENQNCADGFAKLPSLEGMKKCMITQPNLLPQAAHSLKFLMKRNTGELAAQLLSVGMIPFLLDVLAGKIEGSVVSAATRAELVDALKTACLDLQKGEEISAMLEKSRIWDEFKDQRHDLFLPAARTQAITGGTTGVAGYLTEGMFNPPPLSNAPPPYTSQ